MQDYTAHFNFKAKDDEAAVRLCQYFSRIFGRGLRLEVDAWDVSEKEDWGNILPRDPTPMQEKPEFVGETGNRHIREKERPSG